MRRLCIVPVVLALSCVSPVPAAAAPDPRTSGGPRVRPYDTRSANLLIEGLRRSETFRAIVDQLEAGDVIVYIETQRMLKKGIAGKMNWLSTTPLFRYVRISLNPELTGPVAVATLGHELQHALEVANEPSVVDDESLESFYRATGISMRSHANSYDTFAAREVGYEIRREVASSGAVALTARAERLDPVAWALEYRHARESMR